MAGSSNFPTSVDNKTAIVDGVDYIEGDDVNNAYVPLTATQTFVGANGKGASWSTDILEYLANTKAPICVKASASTISVLAGVVFIKNSGQSNRLMRRNTATVTLTTSDLDTGSFADDTYYYIYAVADSAATTFTCKISASASSPTGLTNFELIGWFFNQSASALDVTIDYVGNVKSGNRDVPNVVIRKSATADSMNDAAYGSDITETEVRFYSSGRPVMITASAQISDGGGGLADFIIDVDGTDKTESEKSIDTNNGDVDRASVNCIWIETLSAGTHTITLQGKTSSGTDVIDNKVITVVEL